MFILSITWTTTVEQLYQNTILSRGNGFTVKFLAPKGPEITHGQITVGELQNTQKG